MTWENLQDCNYAKNRHLSKFVKDAKHGRSQDFGSGERFWGSASWGDQGRSPPDAGEFSKMFKRFLKKIAKNALF